MPEDDDEVRCLGNHTEADLAGCAARGRPRWLGVGRGWPRRVASGVMATCCGLVLGLVIALTTEVQRARTSIGREVAAAYSVEIEDAVEHYYLGQSDEEKALLEHLEGIQVRLLATFGGTDEKQRIARDRAIVAVRLAALEQEAGRLSKAEEARARALKAIQEANVSKGEPDALLQWLSTLYPGALLQSSCQ